MAYDARGLAKHNTKGLLGVILIHFLVISQMCVPHDNVSIISVKFNIIFYRTISHDNKINLSNSYIVTVYF